jgi:hypothetical protein
MLIYYTYKYIIANLVAPHIWPLPHSEVCIATRRLAGRLGFDFQQVKEIFSIMLSLGVRGSVVC